MDRGFGYHIVDDNQNDDDDGEEEEDDDDNTRISVDSDVAEFVNNTNDIIAEYIQSDDDVGPSRSLWVHETNQTRSTLGEHATNYYTRREFPDKFKEYYRLTIEEFDELYSLTAPQIMGAVEAGQGAVGGRTDSLKAVESLALTLRWLGHGGSFMSLAQSYKLAPATARKHIQRSVTAINEVLHPTYMVLPDLYKWHEIAGGFSDRWNFPNCLGSIDGKHIAVQKPDNSVAMYHNYKGTCSIVLLAITDSNYRFIHIDVGEYGKSSDGGTFSTSKFAELLRTGNLNIPHDNSLPGTNDAVPYVFVGDEAFPLQEHLMRPFGGPKIPYEHQVFNYRLSRARHVVENSFGILAARWRVLKKPMDVQPDKATDITEACCLLHNFVIDKRAGVADEADTVHQDGTIDQPGAWRQSIQMAGRANAAFNGNHLSSVHSKYGTNCPSKIGKAIREKFVSYFKEGPGKLHYQDEQVQKHY